jgi:hypothetical protein
LALISAPMYFSPLSTLRDERQAPICDATIADGGGAALLTQPSSGTVHCPS